jgi:hypothetical protein
MNIVIAYDGSNHAKAAVDDLRRSGMPRGVNALVVSVGETFRPRRRHRARLSMWAACRTEWRTHSFKRERRPHR